MINPDNSLTRIIILYNSISVCAQAVHAPVFVCMIWWKGEKREYVPIYLLFLKLRKKISCQPLGRDCIKTKWLLNYYTIPSLLGLGTACKRWSNIQKCFLRHRKVEYPVGFGASLMYITSCSRIKYLGTDSLWKSLQQLISVITHLRRNELSYVQVKFVLSYLNLLHSGIQHGHPICVVVASINIVCSTKESIYFVPTIFSVQFCISH